MAEATSSSSTKKIIIVVSSHNLMPLSEEEKKENKEATKTGWYLPEAAHPWCLWKDAGFECIFVSPKGGLADADPESLASFKDDKECQRFVKECMNDKGQIETVKITDLKDDIKTYDAIFYAGGNGVMWDFKDNEEQNKAAAEIYESGNIVSAVCHGPAGLINVKLSTGKYLIDGKNVCSFTNDEEKQSGLESKMPFFVETELKNRGAKFSCVKNWGSNCEIDERLITGQNPASATAVGKAVIKALNEKK